MTQQICHAWQKWKEQDVTRRRQLKWDLQISISVTNDLHSSKNGKFPQDTERDISHPTLTAEVHCSRYYRLLLWRLKGLPWIWMRAALSRGRRGTWVFSGVFAVFRVRYGGAVQCHHLAMWHFLPSLPGYVNVRCWAEHCAIVGTQGSICGKSAGRTSGSVSDCKISRCGGRTAAFLDRCSCIIRTSWALYPSGREALLNIVWPQWWQRAHNKQCCRLTQSLVTRFQGHLGSKSLVLL